MNQKNKDGATLVVFFLDDIAMGILLGWEKSFGLDVLIDVKCWTLEFAELIE